ncbi:MAG: YfbK domain-containing protein, partial [Verrucomicrobiales bacterium]
EQSSADFRFAVAVASFGMRLRGTEFPGPAPRPEDLAQMVAAANAASPGLEPAERGRREEFLQILQRAAGLLEDPTGAPPAPGVGEDVRRKLEELR